MSWPRKMKQRTRNIIRCSRVEKRHKNITRWACIRSLLCYSDQDTGEIVPPVLTLDEVNYPPAHELWQQIPYPRYHFIVVRWFRVF